MSQSEMLRISNWDRWQSYRRDRGQPPWIKVHRQLLRNLEWVELSDAQRGQLVAIWLLAADHDGAVPASPALIQKLCFMSRPPDLNLFIKLGFLESPQGGVTVASSRRQDVTPEAEAEAEQKRHMSGNGHDVDPVEQVFCHWQSEYDHSKAVLTPKRRKLIRAALKDYELTDLLRSISGYRLSPHHMGDNRNSTIYDDIELLLRDTKHIEAGLGFYRDPPKKPADLEQQRQEVKRLAELLGISERPAEQWGSFEKRVLDANDKRVAAISDNV